MGVLMKFHKYGQKSLLSNPILSVFLDLKWDLIKGFYYLNLAGYFIYLVLLTILIYWTSYEKGKLYNDTEKFQDTCNRNLQESRLKYDSTDHFVCDFSTFQPYFLRDTTAVTGISLDVWIALHAIVFVYTFVIAGRECIQLSSSGARKYFKEHENVLEVAALISTLIYLVFCTLTFCSDCDLEQVFGALSLFLSWIEMSLLIGRHPSIGIYIYMTVNVGKQLMKIMLVYFSILMAFACAFSMLLQKSSVFQALVTSFLKVISMVAGEFGFEYYFTIDKVRSEGGSFSSPITQMFYVMAIGLLSIIISNLIIGLTVQDIIMLQDEASVYRLHKTMLQVIDTAKIYDGTSTVGKLFKGLACLVGKVMPSCGLKDRVRFPCPNYSVSVKPHIRQKFSSTHLGNYLEVFIFNSDRGQAGSKICSSLPNSILGASQKGT